MNAAERGQGGMQGADVVFWIVAAALAALAAVLLVRAALRADGAQADGAAHDLCIYRDQMAEVDRDLARGTLPEDEAERTRTEIARRILEADRTLRTRGGGAALTQGPVAGLGLIGIAVAAAFGVYGWLGAPGYPDVPMSERLARADRAHASRQSQAEAEAQDAAPLKNPADPGMAKLIEALRTAVKDRPDDLKGHQLLAENEARLGNRAAAAAALAAAVRIEGEAAAAGDYAKLADAYVAAARGYVSPQAEAALNAALTRDPGNGTARFYAGLMYAQTLRPDLAFAIWRDLLEKSPPDAPWVPVIRDRIGLLAEAAGVDYVLPDAVKGPEAGDAAAAQDMSPEDRMKMIRGMVDGLSARLASQGGTPEEWAQLVNALGVLGETDKARGIWAEAQTVFRDKPDAIATVEAAAKAAGVAE